MYVFCSGQLGLPGCVLGRTETTAARFLSQRKDLILSVYSRKTQKADTEQEDGGGFGDGRLKN